MELLIKVVPFISKGNQMLQLPESHSKLIRHNYMAGPSMQGDSVGSKFLMEQHSQTILQKRALVLNCMH